MDWRPSCPWRWQNQVLRNLSAVTTATWFAVWRAPSPPGCTADAASWSRRVFIARQCGDFISRVTSHLWFSGSAGTRSFGRGCGQSAPFCTNPRCDHRPSCFSLSTSSLITAAIVTGPCSITRTRAAAPDVTVAPRVRFRSRTKFATMTAMLVTFARVLRGKQMAWFSATARCTARLHRVLQQVASCGGLSCFAIK